MMTSIDKKEICDKIDYKKAYPFLKEFSFRGLMSYTELGFDMLQDIVVGAYLEGMRRNSPHGILNGK
jgi:hypothetical protein